MLIVYLHDDKVPQRTRESVHLSYNKVASSSLNIRYSHCKELNAEIIKGMPEIRQRSC